MSTTISASGQLLLQELAEKEAVLNVAIEDCDRAAAEVKRRQSRLALLKQAQELVDEADRLLVQEGD